VRADCERDLISVPRIPRTSRRRYQDSATSLLGPDGDCLAYVPYGVINQHEVEELERDCRINGAPESMARWLLRSQAAEAARSDETT